jgi:CheY-like chemotaxis protein/serine phosphatase RsbU (regulator of sigma subunit)
MATVLVVDDDPISREFLRTLLDYRGHHVREAADGDSALALAGRQPPDAVITDVLMPGLDGYELARMLRSRPDTRHIPIAFSTAHYGWSEIRPLVQACGVQEVIFKPAQPMDVLAIIDALLAADRVLPTTGLLERASAIQLGPGRLHAIATTAPVGLLLADSRGSAYYVNPRLTRVLGRPESGLLGTGWLDRLEPTGRERLLTAVTSGAIRDGRPYRVATAPGDADPRWLDICLYPVEDGPAGDIVGVVEDLAAAAHGQDGPPDDPLLRRHVALLAGRLADTQLLTRSGTWDLDLETDMVVLSPVLRELLGLPSTRVRRDDLRDRVHPEDLARIAAMTANPGCPDEPSIIEVRVAGDDGAVHELIVSYRMATPDRESAKPTLWGVAQDITHIRHAQRAQLQAQAAWYAERRVIDSFHRAVLPATLPTLAGVDLGASYLAAPYRLDIGAGWYDAFVVRDGAILLSVGKVPGADRYASAVVSGVRAVVRAYALDDADPLRVLTRLNRFLLETYQDTFATAVVGLYEPDTGRLRLANAGQAAPFVISPEPEAGPTIALPRRGPALGVLGDAEFVGQHVVLPPEAALCVYTDGLTDRHGDPTPDGHDRLPVVAARAFEEILGERPRRRLPAQRLADRVIDDMVGGDVPEDDVCVAVLWACPDPP